MMQLKFQQKLVLKNIFVQYELFLLLAMLNMLTFFICPVYVKWTFLSWIYFQIYNEKDNVL